MPTIELGYIPPASVRGNSRAHHIVKWRDSQKLRDSGFWHGCVELIDMGQVDHITLTFEFHHNRLVDHDNLAIGMKPWVDGLVEAGIVLDDSPDHVSYGQNRFVKCPRGESKTIVEVSAG